MKNKNYLVVPTQLDALVVHNDHYAVQNQMADFTLLPYATKGEGDINSSTAYIGESINQQAFGNNNLQLGQGVHLHWALPDGLTKGKQVDGELDFPAVPNRWLISKKRAGVIEQQWVVESDYLFPEKEDMYGIAVSVPADKGEQPYRYMGRKMAFSVWKQHGNQGTYLDKLTAVGYGEPAFAAFYPNCYSVFGFHDKGAIDLTDLEYEVMGWYSEASDDVLYQFMEAEQKKIPEERKTVQEEFEWTLPEGFEGVGNLLCLSELKFSTDFEKTYTSETAKPKVTVGNSTTEALSAALADYLQQGENKAEKNQSLIEIEDQLEAIQLAVNIQDKALDIKSRFYELRHKSGFKAHQAAYSWEITQTRKQQAKMAKKTKPLPPLPDALIALLTAVNQLQDEYDEGVAAIISHKEQVFADWYKYMISIYPPDRFNDEYPNMDELSHFIKNQSLAVLQSKVKSYGEFGVEEDEEGNFKSCTSGMSLQSSIAYQLAVKLNELLAAIEALTQERKSETTFAIKRVLDPRFWEPNDPAVLIEGDGVEISQRHGQDGTLALTVVPAEGEIKAIDFPAFHELLHEHVQDQCSFIKNKQPWFPFLLDWEVQFYPIKTAAKAHLRQGNYAPTFITENYEVKADRHDLDLKQTRGAVEDQPATYIGSSILTGESNELLQAGIKDHMKRQGILAAYEKEQKISFEWQNDLETLISWYTQKEDAKKGVVVQLKALQKMQSMRCMSQVLGGLNKSFLMRKSTLSFPVDDPLAFGDATDTTSYKGFTKQEIAAAVGENNLNAPDPLNQFHPIRSGVLKLNQMRLVDTFGQTKTLNCENIDTSYSLTSKGNRYLIKLPPRICQPARLRFDFISKKALKGAITPAAKEGAILGWFLTNKLDKSLMVYDSEGKALGYFKAQRWHEAIDSEAAKQIHEIKNRHLRATVEFVQRGIDEDPEKENPSADARFLAQFMGTIDDALDNIQPEVKEQPNGISLLIGKPVAIVRTALHLEVLGEPAVNQSWDAFKKDWTQTERTIDGFTNVKYPIRMGEYGQLNDSLIGYWLEEIKDEEKVFTKDLFYSPQSDFIDTNKIESQYRKDGRPEPPINFHQSIADKPQILTVLMQPQGTLHATVGVLPNREIAIPPSEYNAALDNIEISFLTAPVLTHKNKMQLLLSPDKEFEWSWVERSAFAPEVKWKEIQVIGKITRADFDAHWESEPFASKLNAVEVWYYLLTAEVGWLEKIAGEIEDEIVRIVPSEKRKIQVFEKPFEKMESAIDKILNTCSEHVQPALLEADFTDKNELKEGWIKIRKPQSTTTH